MSLKQFDYASAWREVAKPAYEALPQNVRDLLVRVATEAGDLRQLSDTSMPWPVESDLRERFDKIPAEILAFAARVINVIGHWYPGGAELEIPGRNKGATWKFSHYADQSLRARLTAATSEDAVRTNGPFQIHEGAIRFCYSSRDMWTWAEVAPATVEGLTRARKLSNELSAAFGTRTSREARDSAAYRFFETLKTRDLDWPREWAPLMDTAAYMREPAEIAAEADAATPPEVLHARVERRKAEEIAKAEREIWVASRRRDGHLWAIDQGLPVDNLIFYDHQNDKQGVFCFGWREKIGPVTEAKILAVISEFPYAYRILCADGRTLEGGIG